MAPLINIIMEHKLTGDNYKEWKRNLMLVLTCEKYKFVLTKKCPTAESEAKTKWKEADDVAKCYIIGSMSSALQSQHENMATAKDIMDSLEQMFGGQETLARQTAITNIMNSKMKPGTPIKDHMLKLMGYFAEAKENGANLEPKIQSEMVFSSLSRDFVGFKAAYNLGEKELELTQLMKQLQSYEVMMNGGKPITGEANLAVASTSGPIRGRKRKHAKEYMESSSTGPSKKKGKKKKKDVSKVLCFFCDNKGHFKRDCPEFKRFRNEKVDGENSK